MPTQPDEWVNVAPHSVTLAAGGALAPGDRAQCDMKDPHDKALRDAGHLIKADQEAKG